MALIHNIIIERSQLLFMDKFLGRLTGRTPKSVPIETLRRYVMDLEKIKDPSITLVMRGFVDGARLLKPTASFLSRILKKEPPCDFTGEKCAMFHTGINIDPMLFGRYGITQVPAVVYVPRLDVIEPGMSEGDSKNAAVQDFYVVHGDAALDYVFERIHSASGSKTMGRLVQALRKGFY